MFRPNDPQSRSSSSDRWLIGDEPLGYRSLHAPSNNNAVFMEPSADQTAEMLRSNRSLFHDSFWTSLQVEARRQLIDDAKVYTSRYHDVSHWDHLNERSPIIMSGHQPTLFHPGVWLKNFRLSNVASELHAIPINLIIDNDVASGSSIRVPQIDDLGRARWHPVAYDSASGGVPFEQAEVRDVERFNQFDSAISDAISPIVADPLVRQLWPHAKAAIRRCGFAGCALAQARHALEAELGWRTLELPLGVAVRGLPFAKFVMRILDEATRFSERYNSCADRYRAWHGIRSSAHPVPNLALADGWVEVPLWVYGNQSPQRRGLWARRDAGILRLSDRAGRELQITATDPDRAAEQLADQVSPEFKMRPRALVTTMYSRLVLSDLFLHGIGGGKYDQLSDRIIADFFQITPPAFQVVSGTFRLPGIDRDVDRPERIIDLQRKIRQTGFQGERFLDSNDPQQADWIGRKSQLIHCDPSVKRAAWHQEITELNETISQHLNDVRDQLRCELTREREQAASESILASREHSFCLFPLEDIQNRLSGLATACQ